MRVFDLEFNRFHKAQTADAAVVIMKIPVVVKPEIGG